MLDDTRIAAICKALGHPARIQILRHLMEEDRCICGKIVTVMSLAQSTVSQHLKILKDAGLVKGEVEGPRTCYCINRETLASFEECMKAFAATGLMETNDAIG